MKNINLREYYPSIYPNDFYITVSDDIAEVFRKSENTEKAYYKKKKRNKAYYSLDADPSLESHILGSEPSPMVLYEQKHLRWHFIRQWNTCLKSNIEGYPHTYSSV